MVGCLTGCFDDNLSGRAGGFSSFFVSITSGRCFCFGDGTSAVDGISEDFVDVVESTPEPTSESLQLLRSSSDVKSSTESFTINLSSF